MEVPHPQTPPQNCVVYKLKRKGWKGGGEVGGTNEFVRCHLIGGFTGVIRPESTPTGRWRRLLMTFISCRRPSLLITSTFTRRHRRHATPRRVESLVDGFVSRTSVRRLPVDYLYTAVWRGANIEWSPVWSISCIINEVHTFCTYQRVPVGYTCPNLFDHLCKHKELHPVSNVSKTRVFDQFYLFTLTI